MHQPSIEAIIQGDISGQVAVGSRIIQIGSVHGGVVNIASAEQQPRLRLRLTPVSLLPRSFPNLVGRKEEIQSAIATLQSKQSVEFYSQPGLGKTVLLRHLAYQPQATSPFRDGIVSLAASRQPVADLLQSLFDAFYESDIPFKPTDTQIHHHLQGKQALILLDRQKLPRDEVEALMNAAPNCTFLFASPERCLWGEGIAVKLRGLPLEDALTLLEKELQRQLTTEELSVAKTLCTALEGHPLQLLLAIANVREGETSLAEIVHQVKSATPDKSLLALILALLQKPQQRILALLAALGGIALLIQHVAALTALTDIEAILQMLLRRNLVQVDGDRYSINHNLVEALQQEWDLTPWRERTLTYFTTWVEQYRLEPGRLLEQIDAIAQTLEWAVSVRYWKEVLQMVKAVEEALALGKQWGLWAQFLQWGLQAAQQLGDKAAEAWALHQLGTRALCLEDYAIARDYLTKALELRESLGDEMGASVTRHNLNLVPVALTSSQNESQQPIVIPRKPGIPLWLAGIISLLLLSTGGLLVRSILNKDLLLKSSPSRTTPTPSKEPSLKSSPSPTTPTPSPTPAISLSNENLNFSRQEVEVTSQPRSITIKNIGSAPLQIRDIKITGSDRNDFSITANNCKTSIQPKQSCTVRIGFTPTAIGKRSASLVITHNAAGDSTSVQLSGSGFNPPKNQPPVAKDDTETTQVNTPVAIDVLANDRDPDDNNEKLAIAIETQPKNGAVSIEAGKVIYQPKRDFSGIDRFEYKISDGKGGEDTATVTITVEQPPEAPPPPNRSPVAKDDTASTQLNQPVSIDVLANDRDPDDNNDKLAIAIETQPENGAVSVEAGKVIYQPKPDFSGTDRFKYKISDGKGGEDIATVIVTVEKPQPQPPEANDDRASTDYFTPKNIAVLDNDRYPNRDKLTLTIETPPQNGSAEVNDDKTITYTYQPNRGFSGEDKFTYAISDGKNPPDTATVIVTVEQQPNQPTPTITIDPQRARDFLRQIQPRREVPQ